MEAGVNGVDATEVCLQEHRFLQVGFREIGEEQVSMAQINSIKLHPTEISFSQVRANLWMLLSPRIPDRYPLFQHLNVKSICQACSPFGNRVLQLKLLNAIGCCGKTHV